jgi:DNA-binding NtrC family response regulator
MQPETTIPCRVLLIDDDEAFRLAMGKALRRRGFEVSPVGDGATAVRALSEPGDDAPHVAVLDLRMPDLDGLEVLRRTMNRRMPVVVLTGHGSVPDAVEAMRLGAHTFLLKPLDAEALAPWLLQAAGLTGASAGTGGWADGPSRHGPPPDALVGEAPATRAFRSVLDRLATADEPILLTGETGTGKEVAARYLHRHSRRPSAPFVAVNMACLPADLVESELFGHARGSFTGADRRKPGLLEEAGEGMLFLDEIAELPLEHQPKLLRVLETRSYRPVGETRERPFLGRLVAATHRDLALEVQRGRFRQDLYYRLQVLPLRLPPLRERPDDVLPILRHWLEAAGRGGLTITSAAETALLSHRWPGNVRELVNLARRLTLFAEEGRVDAALVRRMLEANPFAGPAEPTLDPAPRGLAPDDAPVPGPRADPRDPEALTLESLERRHTERLLAHHRNVTRVADILGINRRTLQRKLRAWGIDAD